METFNIESGSPSKLDINDNNADIDSNNILLERISKKKFKFPFIVYLVIFTLIILIILLIVLIIVSIKYKEHYKYFEDIYTKPQISDHNYSRLLFDNNLEIILTQVNFNDTAGGALSFEKGYLDLKFEPGFLKLALLCLRYNDYNSLRELNDYMGELKQTTEEFYSTIYFTILNSGFERFLKNFKQYTSHDEDINNLDDIIKSGIEKFSSYSSSLNSVNEKEKYFIEYLVYNITDKDGNEINRQGSSNEVNYAINNNHTKIYEVFKIMDELFTNQKIKLILFSHYKLSLMKKYVLRYLHDLTVHKNKYDIKEDKNEFGSLNTNKIIYYPINERDNNYIKINFYISNNEINISQLYKDSGYFNYLKYILNETNNASLYYNLTHPKNDTNLNINIKSLSCDFEVVLKSKIRFSILILLNHYSYNNIKEIIEITYEYIDKIKAHINNMNMSDERFSELLYITKQNFSFTEDVHSGEFYKKKAEELFYKNDKEIFLKDVFLPQDLNKNKFNISFYMNQLTKNNSVIIIGINDKTKEKYGLNKSDSSISLIFTDTKPINYFQINYSIHNISDIININDNDINNKNQISKLKFYPNKFISNYSSEYKVQKIENDHSGKYESINDTNNLVKFYWLKDTCFQLPKVCVIIYFFHPFQRPNFNKQEENDIPFYHLILYLSYIQRQINILLADAMRAGTYFKLGYAENYLYIDIEAFSDVIEEILKIFKEIITRVDYDTIKKDYEIYKDYTFENLLNLNKENIKLALRHEYSKYLTTGMKNFPPIYNYYNFQKENFENFELNKTLIDNTKIPILYTFIMGYYEKEEAINLYNIFNQNMSDSYLIYTLDLVNYTQTFTGDKFVKNSLIRDNYKATKTINNYTYIKNNLSYSFMNFVEFSDYNRIPVEIFRRIIEESKTDTDLKADFTVEIVNQRNIYLRFYYPDKYNFSQIKERAKKILKDAKADITEQLDIFGGRFYYLLRNIENEYIQTPNDLFDAAVDLSYNQLYERDRFNSKYKLDNDDYDNFTKTIEKFFEDNPHYFEANNIENKTELSKK